MQIKALTKKVERVFCTILSLFLLILPLNVSVFSASDSVNLVDSDLRNWVSIEPDCSRVVYHTAEDVYQIIFTPQYINGANTWLRIGAFYSLSDFVAGNSYTFNFDLLNFEQLQKLGFSISESVLFNGFTTYGGELFIGLASYNSSLRTVEFVEDCSFIINGDNYLDFFGKSNKITFELSNISNPVIAIAYYDVYETGNNVSIFFDNVTLTDNTQSKEDGFLSRLFDWFQEKFDDIGDSFSNLGNKLTDLKNGFVNKLTELKDSFLNSISNLANSIGNFFDEQLQVIENFFTGFANLILYFNWNGEYNNPFADSDITVGNGADNTEHLILAVEEFNISVDNLTHYLSVPSKMLKTLGEKMPIIPIIVLFSLVGLVVMRLFGVRRDS